MKLYRLAMVLSALTWALSGCVHSGPPPKLASNPDIPFNGPALPVVLGREIERSAPDKTRPVSEAVRNYLRDALEEALESRQVFRIVQAAPGTASSSNLAVVTASITLARVNTFTLNGGPFVGFERASFDATMEVRLQRPGRKDLVFFGQSSVKKTEDTVIVASKQFKDWPPEDSWAAVACKQALQQACQKMAVQIETERRVVPETLADK